MMRVASAGIPAIYVRKLEYYSTFKTFIWQCNLHQPVINNIFGHYSTFGKYFSCDSKQLYRIKPIPYYVH